MTVYKHLFTPVQLRHKTLRNRIVFGAHTANMAVNGLPGEQHLAYYRERALGGAAMMVIEPMPVHPAAVLTRGNFRHGSDSVIPHFRRITEAVKAEGCVILQQLYHVGQHGDADNSYHANWSPSGLPSYHDSDGSHAMRESEIEETIEGFVSAAVRCYKAGFDGVEIWAAYHGLVDQFWLPWSNRRDDRWGGSLENRTRFSREILSRVRKACGDDFILGLAINDEPDVSIALNHEAMCEIIVRHDRDQLMDYVTCGSGSYFDFYKLMPTFLYPEKLGCDLSEAIKPEVKHTLVTAESHIRTPDNAEAVIASRQADLVSIVRGQIADPQLANKARAGQAEQIRACLSCNQMCWGRRSRDYWISCLINPSTGREWEWNGDRPPPAERIKSVLVVGGGPAGLEAARTAAIRGHGVTLVEASPQLGGQFRLAGLQPRRAQITDLLHWYQTQFDRLSIDLRFNTCFDADDIEAFGAEEVILATGCQPDESGFQRALTHLDRLPGVETGNVWSVEDVMMNAARLRPEIVLLDEGGNWRGCGTAWKLADDGYRITLVTPDPMVGKELQRSATDFPLRQRLAQLGVRFLTDSAILEWGEPGASVISLLDGNKTRIAAGSLVLACSRIAENSLAGELVQRNIVFREIGDCVAPRQAAYAFYDGRKIGLQI